MAASVPEMISAFQPIGNTNPFSVKASLSKFDSLLTPHCPELNQMTISTYEKMGEMLGLKVMHT